MHLATRTASASTTSTLGIPADDHPRTTRTRSGAKAASVVVMANRSATRAASAARTGDPADERAARMPHDRPSIAVLAPRTLRDQT
jgi:hypothetical protein